MQKSMKDMINKTSAERKTCLKRCRNAKKYTTTSNKIPNKRTREQGRECSLARLINSQ